MLADPAFREKVSAAQDVVSATVAVDRTDEGFVLTNDQVQRTDGLPSFAKKFAGETTRAIQVEEWADAAAGSLRIEAPGKPSSIDGTIALVPDGSGTTAGLRARDQGQGAADRRQARGAARGPGQQPGWTSSTRSARPG